MTQPEKLPLAKGKEPYLSTLYDKALDNRSENPILGDRFADEVVRRIELRKRLYLDRRVYQLIASSATDLGWLDYV